MSGRSRFVSRVAKLTLLAVLAAPATRAASGCGPWEWVNPLPQGNSLWGAAYVPGIWMAVGDAGTILTSPDGLSWSAPTRIVGAYDIPRFVAASDERFVAVGEGGFIASEDAMTWRPVWQVAEPLGNVTWAGGRFMAFGSSRVVYTSLDGLTWAEGEAIRLTDKGVTDVTFDGTAVVAVGDGGTILRAPCVPPYPVRPRLERAEPRRTPTGLNPLLR